MPEAEDRSFTGGVRRRARGAGPGRVAGKGGRQAGVVVYPGVNGGGGVGVIAGCCDCIMLSGRGLVTGGLGPSRAGPDALANARGQDKPER